MRNFSSVNRVKLFTYKFMKIIMKIIYENCGVKNYVKKDHRSYTYTTFAVGERKPFAVAFITAMIFFHVIVYA